MKHLSTDVLVIGSGGAGLRAAIEARRHGINVLVISKSKTGLASCTASAGGVFRVSSEGKGIEKHFKETLEAGRFLNNPHMVETLVTKAWPAVKGLEKFGIQLLVEKEKTSVVADTRPAGINLSKALTRQALNLGASVVEEAIVFDLFVEANRCLGALVFKRDTGEIFDIAAKVTVLATGGYAGLYVRNDNPQTITGDGLFLAYKAGAELQDLELVQFQPITIDAEGPQMTINDWLIEATKNLVPGGPLTNKKGERFLRKYGLLNQRVFRDNLIVAIERQLLEDKDNEESVILDLTSLSPNEIEEAFELEYQKEQARHFKQMLSLRRMHVASAAHYTMGGVRTNQNCQTRVEGLYAVGEVASGIHGANRLAGNALTEIMVFGEIAGRHAAEQAKHSKRSVIDKRQVRESVSKLQQLRDRAKPKTINPSSIKNEVKSVVSRFCRPVRNQEGLKLALDELKRIEEKAPFMFAANSDQLKEAIEANFMLSLAGLVIQSALIRKESRGSHFREDFPESDDGKWLKNIAFARENSETRIRFEPIIKTN